MDTHFVRETDPRLLISDSLNYKVVSGAASISAMKVQATSVSNTQAVFNVQVPSMKTVVDTHVLWSQKVQLKIPAVCAGAGIYAVNIGRDALCPFPLNSMISTASCTINNATTTCNSEQVLPAILNCIDRNDLNLYQSTTAVALDRLYDYTEGDGMGNNVLGGWESADLNNAYVPRGAVKLISISSSPTAQVALVANASTYAYIDFEVQEPLFALAPWDYTSKEDRPCLTGVQNMNFSFNFNSGARLWRWMATAGVTVKSCVINKVYDSYLHFQMLSPHSSAVMPVRSVLPYYTTPRYIQTISSAVAAGSTASIPSTTMTLNSIPDTLIIYVKDSARVDGSYADAFLNIDSINLNFNNNNGLLSGFTSHQLFNISQRNGLTKSFYEWSGSAWKASAASAAGGYTDLPMAGSILVLKFGKDIALSDVEAPGVLGNFQLQYNITVKNQTTAAIASVDLCTILINSGLLVSEAGVSSTQLGILNSADVIKTQEQAEEYKYGPRYLGAGIFDTLASIIKPTRKVLGHLGTAANLIPHPGAKVVGSVLKAVGGKNRYM
jgi:hypothetical protein